MPAKTAKLIIADSERDADLYYATHFLAPDPFIFLHINGTKILVMNDLEIDRAKTQSSVNRVLSSSTYVGKARAAQRGRPVGTAEIVHEVLKERRIKRLQVPSSFPLGHADALRRFGYTITIGDSPFYSQRLIKREGEVVAICRTQRAVERAVREAMDILRQATIGTRGRLAWKGRTLTSERLRQVIHRSLLDRDCLADHTIIAGGRQSCDPHNSGSGPLFAHQPIIFDVFPRSMETRYFADMSRTVVKGQAPPRLKAMYRAVKAGQDIAFKMIRHGADGQKIHERIVERFEELGFVSGKIDGRMQGFFHGTGHGVGLEIHEPPRISMHGSKLRTGQVVTVEPGLYYADIGGVRLEDMVLVTKTGCKNLTRFPKQLEIR